MVVRKMKEKCKDAARMRREKERSEFVELSRLLPLPQSTTSQLDKASIIRLTSSYLRMRSAFPEGLGGNWGKDRITRRHIQHGLQNQINAPIQQHQQQIRELGSLILQTLDGFVFALHKDGKIMYISETASVHLGLPQIDLTGSSVFEYVHPSDHNDIYEILSLSESDKIKLDQSTSAACLSNCGNKLSNGEQIITSELGRSFCMRMKCILPKRNAGLVNSGYKAIHCNGYLKVRCKIPASSSSVLDGSNIDNYGNNRTSSVSSEWESYALVAVGHSLLPTASTEVKLNRNSFMFRANLDFKLYYVEAPVVRLLGFEQVEMIGQSLYNFVHLNDLHNLEQSHKLLLEKSQVITKYYRLMKKDGGFVWIQSYASLVCNPRNMPKPQHIVSICFVLGVYDSDESCAPDIIYDSNNHKLSNGKNLNNLNNFVAATSAFDNTIVNPNNNEERQSNKLCQHRLKHTLIDNAPKKYQRIKSSSASRSIPSDLGIIKKINDCESMINDSHVHKKSEQIFFNKTMNLCQERYNNNNNYNYDNNNNIHHHQYNSASFVPSKAVNINPMNQYPSLASIRRPSDDTCSIVSSVASTSLSSISSSQQSSSSSSSSSSSTSSEYTNYQNITTSEFEHQTKFNYPYNSTTNTLMNMNKMVETSLAPASTTDFLLLDSSCSATTATIANNYETNISDFNSNPQHVDGSSEFLEMDKSDPIIHQSNWMFNSNSCETGEDTLKNQGLSEQFFINQFNYQQQHPQPQQTNICNPHNIQSDSSQAWFTNDTTAECSSLILDYQVNNSIGLPNHSHTDHNNTQTMRQQFSSICQHENTYTLKSDFSCHAAQKSSESFIYFQ